MKKYFSVLLLLALAVSLVCAAPALAAEEKADETQEEPLTEEPAEEESEETPAVEDEFEGLVRLGEETENCGMVKITNMTQDVIIMINIKRSADTEWSENLLLDDDTLEVEESAVLCFELPQEDEAGEAGETEETEEAEETEETDEAEEEPVTYDLQIIFEGVTGGTCHNVVLTDVKDAQIMRAWNSIPYLVYTSVATGEEVDTSEAEQAIVMEEYLTSQSSSGGSSSGGYTSSEGEGCIGGNGLFY